jgi:hypothetical protein
MRTGQPLASQAPPAKQTRLGGDTERLEEGVRYTAREMRVGNHLIVREMAW